MSLELVNTAAAVGTFLVIATTAIAAVIQLRHMRASNQLQGLLTARARIEDEDFNTWFTMTQERLPTLVRDPTFRRDIDEGRYDRNAPWIKLANSYDAVGNLIKNGLLPEDTFLDNSCYRIVTAWDMLHDLTAIVRRRAGPAVWENFEYVYVRSKRWLDNHPEGNYPAREKRAHVADRYLEEDRRLREAAPLEIVRDV